MEAMLNPFWIIFFELEDVKSDIRGEGSTLWFD